MTTGRSEEIRIRYKYRKMILEGKARISLDSARALVGPDCAYHLYGLLQHSRRRPPAAAAGSRKDRGAAGAKNGRPLLRSGT
jgi:hypothetical protein